MRTTVTVNFRDAWSAVAREAALVARRAHQSAAIGKEKYVSKAAATNQPNQPQNFAVHAGQTQVGRIVRTLGGQLVTSANRPNLVENKGKFSSQGKSVPLGTFQSHEEAHEAIREHRMKHAGNFSDSEFAPKAKDSMRPPSRMDSDAPHARCPAADARGASRHQVSA